MGEWWNGIHATLKMLCPKGLRVRVPPRPQKNRLMPDFYFSSFFIFSTTFGIFLKSSMRVWRIPPL